MIVSRAETAQRRAPRPPCADRPCDWDLDTGTPDSWRRAIQICLHCPLRGPCTRLVGTLVADGRNPRGMIWAAIGYDSSGQVIRSLDEYYSRVLRQRGDEWTALGQQQKVVRIVRKGNAAVSAPSRNSSTWPIAGRRIIVMRPISR